jgi:hypothetical protein
VIEFAAIGCSAVGFAACTAELRRRRTLVPTTMGVMMIAIIAAVAFPAAPAVAASFGLVLCILAPLVARQHAAATEVVRVVRSGSMVLMGVMLLLHALGGVSGFGQDAHVHGVTASVIVGALVVVLAGTLVMVSLDPRYRPDLRVGIELWAGVLSCALMLMHA